MSLSPEITAPLGTDLSLLIRTVMSPLTAVTPLSTRGHPTPRTSTFRLQFADGRVLKAARLESAEQAAAVEHVSRCLEHGTLPEVVARSGTALLTQWVEGQPLTAADWPRGLLRQCGALQGRVHTQQVEEASSSANDPLAGWLSRLDRNLAALVDAQALEGAEARSALEVAGRSVPRRCEVGFILGDFCAENIVRRPSGELCVIDNETLAIGPTDYDLGRTWYRWPMTRLQRAAYLEGYAAHRSPADYVAHFPFWSITAIVDGAVFRTRSRPETTPVPVHRLRAVLRAFERGVSPEEAMYYS